MRRASHLLALGVLVVGACSSHEPVSPTKTVVILFDRSDSTQGAEVRDSYARAYGAISERIGVGDAIVAGWITDHSASELEFLVNEDFHQEVKRQPNSLMQRAVDLKMKQTAAKRREELKAVVDAGLHADPRKVLQTDILGSIEIAQRAFARYGRAQKYLVVMSDMIHETPDLNMKRLHFTDTVTEKSIQDMQTRGRIADLRGVRVYIVGAQAPDDAKYREIKGFWLKYFHQAGATVVDYGAGLLKFP